MSAGHAFQHVLEIGEGLDVIELGGGNEGTDGCPSGAAAVGFRPLSALAKRPPVAVAGRRHDRAWEIVSHMTKAMT
jgi:hypothetical protein